MLHTRTLRRSTELANCAVIVAFGAFGVVLFAVGLARHSWLAIILGLLYASATIWYFQYVVFHVASQLQLETSSNEVHWRALAGKGAFSLASLIGIHQSPQPDIYVFVLEDNSRIQFWHRNRHEDAQEFFQELQSRVPNTSFEPLYARSKAPWRRGLPRDDASNALPSR
jgi:hypothetical protein